MANIVAMLYKRGHIDKICYCAGITFAQDFADANCAGMSSLRYGEKLDSGGKWLTPTEAITDRSWRVLRAIKALGGWDSICGKIAWDVIGLEKSLKCWAKEQGINPMEARGFVRVTLQLLAKHYGYI